MKEIKSVYEFAWLTTQQILVTSDAKGQHIKGFGSGFFFLYKDKLFFVTADHISHSDDFEKGIRLGKDDFVWVLNNVNHEKELASMITPIAGLFSFDMMNIEDELSFRIPEMKDISFAILPNSFNYPFLTHELKIDEDIIVAGGEEKLIIRSQCTEVLKDTDFCLIEGCVQWDIKDGIRLVKCNAIYQDLRFEGLDTNDYYILKHSAPIKYKDWAGLSGAPVFNDNNRLIGMAIRISEIDDTVIVVPMGKITELMDLVIKYEECIDE